MEQAQWEPPIGAYFVVRTSGFVGAAIRLLTRSRESHAGIYIGGEQVVEAGMKGAVISPLAGRRSADWSDELSAWITQRDPQRAERIVAEARTLVGRRYGFLDILALGLVAFGVKFGRLRERIARSDRLICSQLVDEAYRLAGVHLFTDGRWPQDVTPGDLAELITAHRWERVQIDA